MDCETASRLDGSSHPVYACVYDTPGGEALVGAGKEVLQHSELAVNDGGLAVVRRAELVQTAAIGYYVPNTASLQRDVVVSYSVSNAGKEPVSDLVIEQEVPGGITYKLHVGAIAAGKSATASFSFKGAGAEMPEPVLSYGLPVASFKAANASVDEMLDLWLLSGTKPLAGENVEVTSPSGYTFGLRTDEYGKASFKPREVGPYILQLAHRELSRPAYVYAIQKYEVPEGQGAGVISSGTAFLFAGIGGVRSIIGLLGPVGTGIVIVVMVLAGWVFYRMRRAGEGEAVVAGEVPAELARYRSDEGQYSGLPPEARIGSEPLALTEEEKFKIMESAVELSPREKIGHSVPGSIHSRAARRALRGAMPKHAGRKRRAS